MPFIENCPPGQCFLFVLFQDDCKRGLEFLQIFLSLSVPQHIAQHRRFPTLVLAQIFVSILQIVFGNAVHRALIASRYIVVNKKNRFHPAHPFIIWYCGNQTVLNGGYLNETVARRVYLPATAHLVAQPVNVQYEFLPRLCKTLFVCQSRNAERSANRVDCAFKTVDLEQIQVQTAAVAFRFVRLVKIRQKFQFKKKMTGAKFRRIITFPTVAMPFWKHDQIFAVRISQIAVFEIVPFGRIRAVQQILIAPPAAVFLPHKIEGK